ncbi:invasion associated locus B family protein [Magnetospirillum sp. UT-4]|uniref:invasion associated locus B family protein n=1 Tax=Magnetospirillum sp. UT-4 TaxID=2681467 RepID=UPI00137DAE14|nr:invasion associated locus B family protein [Magnetospirillum sp. UT-4]CAA7613225.1 conserved exported hypothetical protein [Magnetospirillum sp. UT-4]
MPLHLRAIIPAVLILAWAGPALAEDATRILDAGHWEAYAFSEGGGKVCYAAARATRTQGGTKDRKGTAMAVTHRPRSPGEVSIIGAYGFKTGSEAEIAIGGMKHAFFTKGTVAWAKEPRADAAILAAMVKGREVVVRATPGKGQSVTDTIPLTGFAEALAAIDKACGVKR